MSEKISWEPNKNYDNETTWPPEGHPLYGLFHDARLWRGWNERQYEELIDWLAIELQSLRAQIDGLRSERDALERNRDMWRGQCDRQAATLLELRGEWAENLTTARADGIEVERLREALEPLANLELPKYRPEGNAGFYSIRFAAIENAKAALSPPANEPAKDETEVTG